MWNKLLEKLFCRRPATWLNGKSSVLRRRRVRPALEALEDRCLPANLTVTAIAFTDQTGQVLSAIPAGGVVNLGVTFQTVDLPADSSYSILFTVGDETKTRGPLTLGAGEPSSILGNPTFTVQEWGWVIQAGTQLASVTLDPYNQVAETTKSDNTMSMSFTAHTFQGDLNTKMVTPLAGVPGKDFAISNYVDMNPEPGILSDFRGGPYTYDNHNGDDILLNNFASQDVGVPVMAAADGTVVWVTDGLFDRNTTAPDIPVNVGGNEVVIDHGNGWFTRYCHLRVHSPAVAPGDHVSAGEIIGLAASSGRSTAAHLHFEVLYGCTEDANGLLPGPNPDGVLVEPFANPDSFWFNPMPYTEDWHGAMDFGITDHPPSTNELQERPVEKTVFQPGQDVTFWANVHGIRASDQLSFIWTTSSNPAIYVGDAFSHGDIGVGAVVDTLYGFETVSLFETQEWTVTLVWSDGVTSENLAQETFTVTTDPTLLAGTIQFNASNYYVTENPATTYFPGDPGDVAFVTLTRSGDLGAVTVDLTSFDGTASAGTDYVSPDQTITFNDGERSKQIAIPILDDDLNALQEPEFLLLLSNPTGGAQLGDQVLSQVNIVDHTPPFPGSLVVGASDAGGTYNGRAFAADPWIIDPSRIAVPNWDGISPSLTYSTASGEGVDGAPTSAGSYLVVASLVDDTGAVSASGRTTFTIKKATPTISLFDRGGTFNGSAFPATAGVAGVMAAPPGSPEGTDSTYDTDVPVSGVPSRSLEGITPTLTYYPGTSASGRPLPGAPSNPGTYMVLATFPGSADYNSATAAAVFTIKSPVPAILQGSGQGIATDAAGNYYVAGYVPGTLSTFDTDGYVAKYSPGGVLLWSQILSGRDPYGNSFGDSANAIAVDGVGNVYVTGVFRARMDFGNNIVLTSVGVLDGFVEKLDPSGNVLWAHQLANTGNFGPYIYDRLGTCAPKGIAVDHLGNVVVTGFFSGHIDMDPAHAGLHTLDTLTVHTNAYVVKLDTDGNYIWEAQVVVPDSSNAYAVAVDAQNNAYITGDFDLQTFFNDKTANNSNQPNAHSLSLVGPNWSTLFIWKLNADGTNAWVRPPESSKQYEAIWGLGIAVDKKGDIYTTGAFNGANVDFDPGGSHAGNTDVITSTGGNFDTFIDKTDPRGHFQWVRQVIGSSDNWGTGIALDQTGNPYITGFSTADTLFGNILLTPASSGGNSFISELSPAGAFLCAHKSVDLAPGSDRAAAIAVDPQGFVDITGAFSQHMQWPGLPFVTGTGSSDILIVSTMLTCSPVVSQLTGSVLQITGTDQANQIVITDDRHWGILVYLDGDPPLAYQGLTEINVNAGGGDNVINVLCPDDYTNSLVPLPDLSMTFGDGNNTCLVSANFDMGIPVLRRWHVRTNSGNGNNAVQMDVTGSVPLDLGTTFGNGNDSSIYEVHGVEQMPLPTVLTVNGGLGNDDIRVISDFTLSKGDPGPQSPITVNINGGGGTNSIINRWLFNAVPGNPGDPPLPFDIPLISNLNAGTGSSNIEDIYAFNPQPEPPGFSGISMNAPITANVDPRRGDNTMSVEFFNQASPGQPPPPVYLNNVFTVNMAGGAGPDTMGLFMGSGDAGGVVISIMPAGLVKARLDGGAGHNTISTNMWLDPKSLGHVDAQEFAGVGTDDLTLNIFGADNPDLIRGLIHLGREHSTVHHTPNVQVVNGGVHGAGVRGQAAKRR
jgi:murein DD-endopeptidase MepM/ murein hydrolase activator NlpD